MNPQRWLTLLAAALAMLGLCLATGHSAPPPRDPGPVLTRHEINNRDWTLHFQVQILNVSPRALFEEHVKPSFRIVLDAANVVFPLIDGSSISDTHFDGMNSRLRVANIVVDEEPRIVDGYQGPTSLAIWEMRNVNANSVTLVVEIPMTTYETRIDEQRAFEIDWPTEPYSPEVASNLLPQLFIWPDEPPVLALLSEWTNNKPRRMKPYRLAKYLAGKCVEHFQPSDTEFASIGGGPFALENTVAGVAGFNVNGSSVAAHFGRGSPWDLPCLLTAVYRAAGIPARLVIALDQKRSAQKGVPIAIRPLVEFYLYDERYDRGEWIPVDILEQRAFSTKAPPLDQLWFHFGHNEKSDFLVPIAYHWHPPTVVTNPLFFYKPVPAIWGWLPSPANPLARSAISAYAYETPKWTKEGFPPRRAP